jgi:long-chain acyl-CoA synthetase
MPTQLDMAIDRIAKELTLPGSQMELQSVAVQGVDLPVFKNAPPNMRAFFAAMMALHADREFLVEGSNRLTFGDVHRQGVRLAAAVQLRFGIAKGDRVAIAMRNHTEWVVAYIGLLHLGAVVVPLNGWWQGEELAYGLVDSGARLVIADEERCRRLRSVSGLQIAIASVRVGPQRAKELGVLRLEEMLDEAADAPWFLPPISPEDDATIMYTSGSTGSPKGAVSTHRGIVMGTMSYLFQGLTLLRLATEQGAAMPPQQVMLLNVPLFHITGSVPVMLVSIAIGRKLVIMHKWDAGDALRLIQDEKCTYFVGVPTMSLELLQHPDRDSYDLSSLVDIAGGGAPRPPEHVQRIADTFKGKYPAIGYGLTETNGVGAGNFRTNYLAKPNSTGRASAPLVEIQIFDDAGLPVSDGAIGEICIRTSANVRGYWNRPTETAAAFTSDGWFKSGDLGYLDEDGYLFIVDRKKDIIIRGGENISCIEVEAAIYAHPSVAEACVFGLPDERLGEIVGAVVFLKPGEPVAPDALVSFVGTSLSAFKVPARLWISESPLPRLGSAKIDKVSLRKLYREKVI